MPLKSNTSEEEGGASPQCLHHSAYHHEVRKSTTMASTNGNLRLNLIIFIEERCGIAQSGGRLVTEGRKLGGGGASTVMFTPFSTTGSRQLGVLFCFFFFFFPLTVLLPLRLSLT